MKDGGGGTGKFGSEAFGDSSNNWLDACELLASSVGMEWEANDYDGPPSLELFNESQKSMHQVVNNPRLMPQTSENPYSPRIMKSSLK